MYSEKKTPDDGQRNCTKHVEFYSKNKFEKLVHLARFVIRISDTVWNLFTETGENHEKIMILWPMFQPGALQKKKNGSSKHSTPEFANYNYSEINVLFYRKNCAFFTDATLIILFLFKHNVNCIGSPKANVCVM